jgi:hypothetical protein
MHSALPSHIATPFRIRKTSILLAFFLGHFFLSAQSISADDIPSDFERGIRDILQLRKGVLVVRLNFRERSIQHFRESGKEKKAFEMKLQQDSLNVELMRAFTRSFSFCPVYFIRSDDYNLFIEGQQNLLLNSKLQRDSSIHLPSDKPYYFLDLGDLKGNMPIDEYHYRNLNKTMPSSEVVAHNALVIKDSLLTQLSPPFPCYVKISDFKSLRVHTSWVMLMDSIQSGKKKTYHEALIIEKNKIRGAFDGPVSRLNFQLGKYFLNRSQKLYAYGSYFSWIRNLFKSSTPDQLEKAIQEEERKLKE